MQPTDDCDEESLTLLLKNDKAPGIDGLVNVFLKKIIDGILSPDTYIKSKHWIGFITRIMENREKKNGAKDAADSYRPITLLTAISNYLRK